MGWTLPSNAVLGIFGKRPDPERVKTRLAAEFGAEFAAEAHEAMLLDTIGTYASERVLTDDGRRVLVFDPPDAGPWFDARVPATFALQPQVPGDLGARMRGFFEGEFEDGASMVVLIGSDSPTLDPTHVISAFLCLEQGRDVVLGPSTDGGYYLIGPATRAPDLRGDPLEHPACARADGRFDSGFRTFAGRPATLVRHRHARRLACS